MQIWLKWTKYAKGKMEANKRLDHPQKLFLYYIGPQNKKENSLNQLALDCKIKEWLVMPPELVENTCPKLKCEAFSLM